MPKRITISVPDDLAKLLAKHGERFNVSGVCQHALRAELDYQALVSKEPNMSMVKRLKAQEGKLFEEMKVDARKHGHSWAEQQADLVTLHNLERSLMGYQLLPEEKWATRFDDVMRQLFEQLDSPNAIGLMNHPCWGSYRVEFAEAAVDAYRNAKKEIWKTD